MNLIQTYSVKSMRLLISFRLSPDKFKNYRSRMMLYGVILLNYRSASYNTASLKFNHTYNMIISGRTWHTPHHLSI